MSRKYGRVIFVLLVSLVGMVFASCTSSGANVSTNWGILREGRIQGHVVLGPSYDEHATSAFLRSGETLLLDVAFTVERGYLWAGVQSALSVTTFIYSDTFDQTTVTRIAVPVDHAGVYNITLRLNGYRGEYDLTWSVEP